MWEFSDNAAVARACRSCPRFGRRWGCPPHDGTAAIGYRSYRMAMLIGIDTPPTFDLRRLRAAVEPMLAKHERRLDGRMTALPGECPYCPTEDDCTRLHENPCRHPGLVRPSLEALGIDVCALSQETLGREITWDGGRMLLVCAMFYNAQVCATEVTAQLSADVSSAAGILASTSRSRES